MKGKRLNTAVSLFHIPVVIFVYGINQWILNFSFLKKHKAASGSDKRGKKKTKGWQKDAALRTETMNL